MICRIACINSVISVCKFHNRNTVLRHQKCNLSSMKLQVDCCLKMHRCSVARLTMTLHFLQVLLRQCQNLNLQRWQLNNHKIMLEYLKLVLILLVLHKIKFLDLVKKKRMLIPKMRETMSICELCKYYIITCCIHIIK